MKFKSENKDRLEAEWNSSKLAPMVRQIVEDAAEYAKNKWNWDFVVTSIFRTVAEDAALHASGIHVGWRAIDIRTNDQDQQAINDVADYVNQKYQYDPTRPSYKVCFKEAHGTGVHAHYQVHPNTKESNATTENNMAKKIIQDKDVSKQLYYELTPERLAILDLIAYTEGTDQEIGNTKKGYNIIYGFRTFSDFSKHPKKIISSGRFSSSAAGRYQILTVTWEWLQKRLQKTGFEPFPSFEPQYQDQAALFLIEAKRHSMKAVDGGDLDEFLDVCSWEWASLPDPDTGKGRYPPQPVINVKKIRSVYGQLFDLWSK